MKPTPDLFIHEDSPEISTAKVNDNKLYHATSISALASIMHSRKMRGRSLVGVGSDKLPGSNKNNRFFISLSRSSLNSFSKSGAGWGASAIVVFDKNALKTKYQITPVSYFGNRSASSDEMEERLIMKNPFMKLPSPASSFMKEWHLLNSTLNEYVVQPLRTDNNAAVNVSEKSFSEPSWVFVLAKTLLFLLRMAKKEGVSVYYYLDEEDFLANRKEKAIPIPELVKILSTFLLNKDTRSGVEKLSAGGGKKVGWFTYISQLVFCHSLTQLTDKEAKRHAFDWWRGYNFDQDHVFRADFHNAARSVNKDRDQLDRVTLFMQQKSIDDIEELIKFLKKKWIKLYQEDYDKRRSTSTAANYSNFSNPYVYGYWIYADGHYDGVGFQDHYSIASEKVRRRGFPAYSIPSNHAVAFATACLGMVKVTSVVNKNQQPSVVYLYIGKNGITTSAYNRISELFKSMHYDEYSIELAPDFMKAIGTSIKKALYSEVDFLKTAHITTNSPQKALAFIAKQKVRNPSDIQKEFFFERTNLQKYFPEEEKDDDTDALLRKLKSEGSSSADYRDMNLWITENGVLKKLGNATHSSDALNEFQGDEKFEEYYSELLISGALDKSIGDRKMAALEFALLKKGRIRVIDGLKFLSIQFGNKSLSPKAFRAVLPIIKEEPDMIAVEISNSLLPEDRHSFAKETNFGFLLHEKSKVYALLRSHVVKPTSTAAVVEASTHTPKWIIERLRAPYLLGFTIETPRANFRTPYGWLVKKRPSSGFLKRLYIYKYIGVVDQRKILIEARAAIRTLRSLNWLPLTSIRDAVEIDVTSFSEAKTRVRPFVLDLDTGKALKRRNFQTKNLAGMEITRELLRMHGLTRKQKFDSRAPAYMVNYKGKGSLAATVAPKELGQFYRAAARQVITRIGNAILSKKNRPELEPLLDRTLPVLHSDSAMKDCFDELEKLYVNDENFRRRVWRKDTRSVESECRKYILRRIKGLAPELIKKPKEK